MQCDMCGRTAQLFRARVEGVELDVCGACARFGRVMAPQRHHAPAQRRPAAAPRPEPETKEALVSDAAGIIRRAREQKKMTQEEFARLLAERESLVQKIEAGQFIPPIEMAKKIERILKVRLVIEEEEEVIVAPQHAQTTFTLGDFVRKR